MLVVWVGVFEGGLGFLVVFDLMVYFGLFFWCWWVWVGLEIVVVFYMVFGGWGVKVVGGCFLV